jgi:hypothetical protein
MAPPLTSTFSRSWSKTWIQDGTTDANPSSTSTTSMSSSVMPSLPSTARVASAGIRLIGDPCRLRSAWINGVKELPVAYA